MNEIDFFWTPGARVLICIFSKIFLDSVFPIDVIKTSRPIYTVDFDQYRDKVLILDDQELLSIYHIENQGPRDHLFLLRPKVIIIIDNLQALILL